MKDERFPPLCRTRTSIPTIAGNSRNWLPHSISSAGRKSTGVNGIFHLQGHLQRGRLNQVATQTIPSNEQRFSGGRFHYFSAGDDSIADHQLPSLGIVLANFNFCCEFEQFFN